MKLICRIIICSMLGMTVATEIIKKVDKKTTWKDLKGTFISCTTIMLLLWGGGFFE